MDDFFPIIDERIHPCRDMGCPDYEAPNGCKSNGGCAKPADSGELPDAEGVEHTMYNCGSQVTKLYCEDYAPDDCGKCPNWTLQKPDTNYDRIIRKKPEQLAEWLNEMETVARYYGPKGKAAWLKWLNQEARED